MRNHLNGTLLLLLVGMWAGLDAQNSPTPVITDYDNTSLPFAWQTGGDTTFCKRQVLTVHGQDFEKATGGESFDTLWAVIGNFGCPVLSSNISGNGNNDRISIRVPQYFAEDTCVRLRLIKRTVLPPDTFYYMVSDTVCLTGDSALVTYGGASFCVGDTAPRPTVTLWPSNTSGLFCCTSGAPGFFVNPANGEIPLHPGAVGASNSFKYVTAHPRCADTTLFTVAIHARQQAAATMNGATALALCQWGGVAIADTALLMPQGGVFRSPTGLHILSAQWGMIDPALSPLGLHQLWYVPGDPCWDSVRIDIMIEPQESPSFSYPPNGVYCLGDPDPWPLVTGTGGGTFLAVTPGTVVDPDGRLRIAASGPGMHLVRYRTPGACADSLDVAVDIYAAASAAFAYAGSSFCTGDTMPLPLITGTPGGTFTADSGCVVNPTTGGIGLDLSLPGTYNITYSHTGSCQSSFTQTVVIGATDTATFISYHPFRFCQSGLDPVPLVVGDTVGRFIAGGGIVFANTDIGQLDVSAMQPGGPYLVTYDIENRCARDVQDSVWIELPDDPGFSYPLASYCEGGVNPVPDSVFMAGGWFAEVTGSVVFADSLTGEIDAGLSLPGGPYFIRHTTSGPCPESATRQVTILPKPIAASLTVSPGTGYCAGETVLLQATAGGATVWRWYLNGVQLGWAADDLLVLDSLLTGLDHVAVAMGNVQGCSDSLTVNLKALAAPTLTTVVTGVATNAFGSSGVDLQVSPDIDGTVVDWVAHGTNLRDITPGSGSIPEFGSTVPASIAISVTATSPHDLGWLTVVLSPRNSSCAGLLDTVRVTLGPDTLSVFVPEVFTPDGNGQNETWMITCLGDADPADYRIYLFNSAGGLVYEMDGLHQNFDGRTLPDGVYWWVLQDLQGRDLQWGGVTIRRR